MADQFCSTLLELMMNGNEAELFITSQCYKCVFMMFMMAGDFNDQVPTLFSSKYEFNVVCSPLIQCVVILMVIGLNREWRRESVLNTWALCMCLYKHGRAKVKVLFLVNSLQCTCMHIHPDTTQQQHTFPVQQKSTTFL